MQATPAAEMRLKRAPPRRTAAAVGGPRRGVGGEDRGRENRGAGQHHNRAGRGQPQSRRQRQRRRDPGDAAEGKGCT